MKLSCWLMLSLTALIIAIPQPSPQQVNRQVWQLYGSGYTRVAP